ncbi:MAG: sulfatase [Deltaproteobacteria bacterium]|nr:sulfatase [Deltaproteobacteria bacterium]
MLDTLRADRMQIYGHKRKTTPYLKRHAQDFLRFANVEAVAPWTVPNHSTMFTGLWPAEHKAQWGRIFLRDEFDTLAEILRGAGFATAALSANPFVAEKFGFGQGFDEFRRIKGTWYKKTQKILDMIPKTVDDALERQDRFFLFVNVMDAHIPYNTKRYGKAFGVSDSGPASDYKVKWEINAGKRPFTDGDKQTNQAAYDAAVRYLDDVVRDVLKIFERKGLLKKTVFVFTSDHGDGLGFHPEIGHEISVWEEQLRVPLIARLPNRRHGGEVFRPRTTLAALAPTVLDWLGVERPEQLRERPDLWEAASQPVTADYRS